ncbi:glycosyltransferase family 1 protein [uncultured Alistipes sp.]|uniref:glycosyltransferase family 4 protein n=1 Tax=uncultured Alistipes sp. TaxID=538949 RepID=UPI00262D34E7|nr:glycosyltransferase family 1 protein [uncultured Alistipes sp.]
MNIVYIFRSQGKEQSIERAFEPILKQVRQAGHDVSIAFASHSHLWFWEIICNLFRFYKISRKYSLCHITGDIQYCAILMDPARTILTIHDLVILHSTQASWFLKKIVYWMWYYVPLKRMRYITCISEATRRDLISFFPWAAHKISVIGNSVEDEFFAVPVISHSRKRILHIGTRDNKNLSRVIDAMVGIDAELRIIGKLSPEQQQQLLESPITYSNAYYLSNEEMLKEYEDCDIVSFPSLFEGFGMPIIEAQAAKKPVLTSNIEPMVTVAGRGALLVDPFDVMAIHDGFKVLINNSELRQNLVAEGIKNVMHYTSSYVYRQYMALYQSVLAKL